MAVSAARKAELYRMVTPEQTCPWGLKALDLLKREGFEVEDHHLKSRAETDTFKTKHQVETTPQTFIDGRRIGGYDDRSLRRGCFVGTGGNPGQACSHRPHGANRPANLCACCRRRRRRRAPSARRQGTGHRRRCIGGHAGHRFGLPIRGRVEVAASAMPAGRIVRSSYSFRTLLSRGSVKKAIPQVKAWT